MGLFTWGSLPKAQDDPTTIDEAIASAIQAHEEDPTSHMGDGESIDEHRKNDVLDHPVGSVLADKQTISEWIMNTVFETLDAWYKTGTVNLAELSGAQMYVEYGATNNSGLESEAYFIPNFFNSTKDMLFQILEYWDGDNTHLNGYFGFLTSKEITANGFGFQLRDGVLYAHVRCGGSTSEESISGFDLSLPHVLRAQYSASENVVYFFIDGVQVASIARPTGGSWSDSTGINLKINVSQTNSGYFYIGNLYVSRQL